MLAFSDAAAVDAAVAVGLRPRTPYTLSSESVFRAELAQIRAEGVAYDREEVAVGLTCVAAPILKHGIAVAALTVAGPSGAFDPTLHATAVRRAANAIAIDSTHGAPMTRSRPAQRDHVLPDRSDIVG